MVSPLQGEQTTWRNWEEGEISDLHANSVTKFLKDTNYEIDGGWYSFVMVKGVCHDQVKLMAAILLIWSL